MVIDIRVINSDIETITVVDFKEIYTLLKRMHLLCNKNCLAWRFKNDVTWHCISIKDIAP